MHSSKSAILFTTLLSLSTAVKGGAVTSRAYKSQSGQTGYNDCGTMNSQSSECQTAVINSLDDFCLWAPPSPGPSIGDSEQYEVAWCTNDGHGTRTMPAGTIHSAHYVYTPHYVQITGTGDFTKINIAAGDEGGELDPHGATGLGNPIGALVYANGVQIYEWTSFISDTEYCFRICPEASDAWLYCQHIYDLQGCQWNEPGDYGSGFDSCAGDSVAYPGVYPNGNGGFSTFQQGDGSTPAPPAHPAGATSNCQQAGTVGAGGPAAPVETTTTTTTTTATTTSVSKSTTQINLSASTSINQETSSIIISNPKDTSTSTSTSVVTTTTTASTSSTTTLVSSAPSSSSSTTSSSSSSSLSSSPTSLKSTSSSSSSARPSSTSSTGSAGQLGARAGVLLGAVGLIVCLWA